MNKTIRNIFLASLISASIVTSAALATPAGAQTVDQLQAQIQELLAKVAALQEQLRVALANQGQTSYAPANTAGLGQMRICASLPPRGLALGVRSESVTALQEFLRAEGYFNADLTGYFGLQTRAALAEWQGAQGFARAGIVGPLTRERIRVRCGGLPAPQNLDASPASGPTPLGVTFTFRPTTDDTAQYYIQFGDGQGQVMTRQQIYCITTPCISPHIASHTYVSRGMYTATVSRYIACHYTNPRCLMAEPPPLASAVITVTGGAGGNLPPSISSFSGPTTLAISETGTWTIQASDPENGQLTYSIIWGDEATFAAGMSAAPAREFLQTTTFTHSYAHAGTYAVTVSVRDNAGQEARTSATVQVGGGPVACTLEYNPVCGRPPGCMNTCPPGMYCTMMCRLYDPVTYGNRCQLSAAGAEYLYAGQCQQSTN